MTAERRDFGQFSGAAQAESSEKNRKEVAAALGLPKNTSWPEINKINMEKRRKQETKVPPKETISVEERRRRSELRRKEMAVKYGLPENAPWPQINKAILKKTREQL